MWLFRSSRHQQEQEARIKAIHEETFNKIDDATKSIADTKYKTEKLNNLIKEHDITELIFKATGGDHR